MFYTYHQNNSGGSVVVSDDIKITVIIEAESPQFADHKAEEIGIYFHGVSDGIDCECCGDRWSRASSWTGSDKPTVDGSTHIRETGASDTIVYYANGVVEFYDQIDSTPKVKITSPRY